MIFISQDISRFVLCVFSHLRESSLLEMLDNILSNKEVPRAFSLGLVWFVFYSLISLGFYARLFVTDLVFIDRANNKLFGLIEQSYSLTKNKKIKIILIIFLSFVVTLPVWIICYLIAPTTDWLIFTATSINTFKSFSPLL